MQNKEEKGASSGMMEKLCYLSFHRMEVMQRKTWPCVFVCLFVCLYFAYSDSWKQVNLVI